MVVSLIENTVNVLLEPFAMKLLNVLMIDTSKTINFDNLFLGDAVILLRFYNDDLGCLVYFWSFCQLKTHISDNGKKKEK